MIINLTPFLLVTHSQNISIPVRDTVQDNPVESVHRRTSTPPSCSPAFQICVHPVDQLTQRDFECWESLRTQNAAFRSPFFSARFASAIQSSRSDVFVASVRELGKLIGVLPFHKIGNVAYPVGRHFNDAHNLMVDQSCSVTWENVLEAINARSFDFHAMVGQPVKTECYREIGTVKSFAACLGNSPTCFLNELQRKHNSIRRQPQKTRKLEREIGPVRMELDCRDPSLLDWLISRKREQYSRTNILDHFAPGWTRKLMHHFHDETMRSLPGSARGLLSILWAGDKPVAGHFGILEDTILHYWFPVYDPLFGRYSPGTALYIDIVRSAPKIGIECIDMGYGEQPYKLRQTDVVSEVSYGSITSSKLHFQLRCCEHKVAEAIKAAPMKPMLKKILRRIQPTAGISKLR